MFDKSRIVNVIMFSPLSSLWDAGGHTLYCRRRDENVSNTAGIE